MRQIEKGVEKRVRFVSSDVGNGVIRRVLKTFEGFSFTTEKKEKAKCRKLGEKRKL